MPQSVKRIEVKPDGSFALRAHPNSYTNSLSLGIATPEATTVPLLSDGVTKARYVIFSGTTDFYVRFNSTVAGTAAAVPGDITDGTACILNPTQRYLGSEVAEISIISPAACVVTLEYFA